MSTAIERLMKTYEEGQMTRRSLLLLLSAVVMSPRIIAQGGKATITTRSLNSVTIAVPDVKRSVAFYQRLFGMPVQANQGETAILRLWNGPQLRAVTPPGNNPVGIVGCAWR